MSVTTEDVQEAVKAIWDGATTLSNPTTGLVKSLIMGRVKDAAEAPYTAFTVRDQPTTRTSQAAYLQTFVVEFKTWDQAGAKDVGAIKAAIEAAFTISNRTTMTLGNGRTIAILHSVKQPGALEEDTATQQGQAVKVSTDRFEILCQG